MRRWSNTADTVYGVVTTLRSEIVARHDRPLTGHDPAEVADLLGEMTTEPAHGHPRLAAAGDPLPARVIEEAGRALGTLVAQISDFVLP
ncbi:hypothetical protein GCM10010340_29340 [Streptomyces griseoloalbus]|nr:hypothetical protein GCM10010340_29340 [Streptomyces albaduncus]